MSESFNRIRKRKLLDARILALLVGLTAGMLTAGIMILVLHLNGRQMSLPLIVGVSLGMMLLVGIAAFLLVHKSDLALARSLDREYSLREKTETMLAFRKSEGAMLELQRENADSTLAAVMWQRSAFRRFGAAAIACLLSAALLVTNIVAVNVSGDSAPAEVPEEKFSISEWQIGALSSLIDNVRFSDFDEELKEKTVAELERLLEAVRETDTVKAMKSEVISSIVEVDLLTEETATYKVIASALGSAEDGNVRLLAASVLTLNDVGFEDNISPIREDFANDTMYLDHITSFIKDVTGTLPESGVDASDPLYSGINAFASELDALLSEGLTNMNVFQGRVDRIFNSAYNSVGTSLAAHYINRAIRTHVIEQLVSIFGISESEIPPLVGDLFPRIELDPDDRKPDDGGKESSGGYGSGDEKFGSNDEIYDPFGEDGAGYVSYPEVYDRYQSVIRDLIAYGDLDHDMQEMLTQYFIRLSDGSKKSN